MFFLHKNRRFVCIKFTKFLKITKALLTNVTMFAIIKVQKGNVKKQLYKEDEKQNLQKPFATLC